MERVLLDLKSRCRTRRAPAARGRADVVIESFRPGVVDRLGIGARRRAGAEPRHRLLLDERLRPDRAAAQWAGHDLNYLAVGGYLDCSGRSADGGPALPGATVGDAAGGGMQAVIAILAALVRARRPARARRSTCRSPTACVALMSLYVDEYFATGEVPAPGHNILTGRYALLRRVPLRRRPLGRGGRDRAALLRQPVPGARLRAVDRAPDRRRRAGRDAHRLRRRVRAPDARRVGRRARAAPTRACRRSRRCPELVDSAALPRARRVRRGDDVAVTATFEQVGWVLAGMDRASTDPEARDATVTDTDALLGEAGYSAAEIAADAGRRSRGVSDSTVLADDREIDRRGAVRGDGRVPGRARLHLDDVRRSRTATRCSGTTRSRRRSPADRSRRRRCCRCGSVRITGRRAAPSRRCRCRSTST